MDGRQCTQGKSTKRMLDAVFDQVCFLVCFRKWGLGKGLLLLLFFVRGRKGRRETGVEKWLNVWIFGCRSATQVSEADSRHLRASRFILEG